MSVLEICRLQVKEGISPSDRSIVESLAAVRSELKSKVVATNSRFYQSIEEPRLIYILGLWPSLAAHQAFLASGAQPAILAPQDHLLDFDWAMHMELDSMASLPLDAPVFSIARFRFDGGEKAAAFRLGLETYRQKIVDATVPYKYVDGWCCDSEPGKQECFVISGWRSVEAHDEFSVKVIEDPEYGRGVALCDEREAKHMRNMET